jgi:AcrR family transcriptional regulator|tara:strand:- start:588 stop:1211 length:624 start_codon:yes stop_codon:yes gene_type:complete
MEEKEQIDGRSLRGEKLYKATHDLLIESAIELFNNPKLNLEEVTLSLIAKNCNLSQAVAYKHFPDRMMDVYGAVAGKRVDEMLEEVKIVSLEEKDLMKLLEKLMVIFTNAAIDMGNATRIAYTNRHILLRKNKWFQRQPVDTLTEILKSVPGLKEKPREVARRIHFMWSGLLFLWISYQKGDPIYGAYSDAWFRKQSKNIISLALRR